MDWLILRSPITRHTLCNRRFRMLAKTSRARIVSDFRPVANLLLLYKLYSYMILHRIAPVLDSGQPEEQLGFRRGRRMEEHLLTADLVVDKAAPPMYLCGF